MRGIIYVSDWGLLAALLLMIYQMYAFSPYIQDTAWFKLVWYVWLQQCAAC